MKTVYYIDNGEIYIKTVDSDYQLAVGETYEDLRKYCKPQVNADGSVIETATPEELASWQAQKRQEKYLIIDSEMRRLSFGAIAIILGLKGLTTEELLARKQLYQTLYEYCSTENPPAEIEQIIEVKRQLFNTMHGQNLTMPEYKQMVIYKYHQAETAFKQFNLMIEAARTKWKSVVDSDVFFNEIYNIIKSVDDNTKPDDVPILFNQVMSVGMGHARTARKQDKSRDKYVKVLSKVDLSNVLKVKKFSKMKKWVHLFFKFVFSILAVSWSVFSAIIALLLSIPIWVLFWYDKHFLPLNFSLYLFSFIGKLGLFPIGFIYAHIIQWLFWGDVRKNLSEYYRDLAVTNDQSGNVYLKDLFNDIFVKENGMLFGDPDETISYVLGYNYVNKSLKVAGWVFSKILNLFDRDHVINAYEND